MKFETLLTRYKNLGYEPKGFEDHELELDSIINWVHSEHKYLITVRPIKGLERRLVNLCLRDDGKKELKLLILQKHLKKKDLKFQILMPQQELLYYGALLIQGI